MVRPQLIVVRTVSVCGTLHVTVLKRREQMDRDANIVGWLVTALLWSYWYTMICLPKNACFDWLGKLLYGE